MDWIESEISSYRKWIVNSRGYTSTGDVTVSRWSSRPTGRAPISPSESTYRPITRASSSSGCAPTISATARKRTSVSMNTSFCELITTKPSTSNATELPSKFIFFIHLHFSSVSIPCICNLLLNLAHGYDDIKSFQIVLQFTFIGITSSIKSITLDTIQWLLFKLKWHIYRHCNNLCVILTDIIQVRAVESSSTRRINCRVIWRAISASCSGVTSLEIIGVALFFFAHFILVSA